MAIPLPPSDLSHMTSHMHPDGCGCDCVEEATELASQYSSTTLLWAFMIRLSNEKDSNATPPTPSSPSGSRDATARQSLSTDRGQGGRDNNSRGKDQARSTAHNITPIASRPWKGKSKDLEKPKQPPSAYLIYQNKVRPSVKLKFPNHTPMEITKEVSVMWKALPHERRQWYIDHARTLRDRWSTELGVYRWKQGATVKKSIPSSWSGSRTGEPSSKRRRGGSSPYEPTAEHENVETD
ncbi:HMG (high mobility group) box protein [Rhizoctonia solani AG-3 Rhs1AP]|uniref:HMG (High mobility group) box protein n=2 Tax=Rhizoctonia solani AG-3 TaxID=1086053 RepID=A0A074S103_9AGAM|nr:HMG (high mobility group) box protein [Rhizoctonia solani AG-3 Rhs1AP]KEP50588.1 HMG (high mobility group) box protein [Rhizoctonia solani 123E]